MEKRARPAAARQASRHYPRFSRLAHIWRKFCGAPTISDLSGATAAADESCRFLTK